MGDKQIKKTLKDSCKRLGGKIIYGKHGIEACKVGSTKIPIEGIVKEKEGVYFSFQIPYNLKDFP